MSFNLEKSTFWSTVSHAADRSRRTSIKKTMGTELFSRLKDIFGLLGKVLELFRSYLEQRYQRVSVHGILSDIQFFVIWCTTGFSSWSSGFHNVYPSTWNHCAAIWG